jgi:hypothetical protein
MTLSPYDSHGPHRSIPLNRWSLEGRFFSEHCLPAACTARRLPGFPSTFALLAWIALPVFAPTFARSAESEIHFGNRYMERVFVVRNEVFRTSELRDKFPSSRRPFLAVNWSYRSMRVASTEFAIYPKDGRVLTTYDFSYRRSQVRALPDGGNELKVTLEDKKAPVEVILSYTIARAEPWMRKQIRITPKGPAGSAMVIERIDVERLGYAQGGGTRGGLGQPIFFSTRNQFFGLEYPAGHDEFIGNVITLTHYPAQRVAGGLASKIAIWAVSPDGEIRQEFLKKYIPSFAVHYPRKPFVNFDEAWNGGTSTSESIAKQTISILNKRLVEQGVAVKSYSFPSGRIMNQFGNFLGSCSRTGSVLFRKPPRPRVCAWAFG